MRDHDRIGIQVELGLTSDLSLDPWRADGNQGLVLQGVGEIHNRAACLFRQLEIGAGELGLRGEKGEIHVFHMVSSHRLHEGDLILDLLQLAKGLVIVKQTNVPGRKFRSSSTCLSSLPLSVAAPTMATRNTFWLSVFILTQALPHRLAYQIQRLA